jgi:hypothetical protein
MSAGFHLGWGHGHDATRDLAFAVPAWLARWGPHGGARCIPVAEYLRGRAEGRLDVQRRFYAGLLMRNGVYKTTHRNRMNELFPMLVSMARRFETSPLRTLDVACSSGVSTVEMHAAFTRAGIDCEAWGSDLLIRAPHVRRNDGCAMLFDHEREPIQVDIGGWATPWRLRPRDRVLRPGRYARARRLLELDVARFRAALDGPVPGFVVQQVPLLSSATDGVAGVHFAEEDIFRPVVPGPFAIIRVANLLNLGYFAEDALRAMGRALCARLMPDGLLMVTRTSDAERLNRGTLFRWTGSRLEVEVTTNGGSEVTDLLLQ